MNGVIVLDKPPEFTSFDAVAVVRGLTREKKTGHTGTLDPMATGVLPLLLGRAAKAASLLPESDKEYRAGFRLGEKTDTGDVTGKVTETSGKAVSAGELTAAMESFRGDIRQIPPMYSAVSVGGKRLYKLAREGIEIKREPRKVRIDRLELESYDEEKREGVLVCACSKGTYIRTLIEDIAQAAGTVGVMTSLRRTAACGFTEADAVTLDELRVLAERGGLESVLRPVESLFMIYPEVRVSPAQAERFRNGGALALERLRLPEPDPGDGALFRVRGESGFIGLAGADSEKNELRFVKLFE